MAMLMGKRRMNTRTSMAQRDDVIIRRTMYVSDIDHQITEEQLAALFINCGQVVDCRVFGELNSALHFAFVEFTDNGAMNALSLGGTMLGYYPVKVLPSKIAIAPVILFLTNGFIEESQPSIGAIISDFIPPASQLLRRLTTDLCALEFKEYSGDDTRTRSMCFCFKKYDLNGIIMNL